MALEFDVTREKFEDRKSFEDRIVELKKVDMIYITPEQSKILQLNDGMEVNGLVVKVKTE